ncbi:MAG: hypothetical protein R2874_09805 [Desulfobacterales bacterium]
MDYKKLRNELIPMFERLSRSPIQPSDDLRVAVEKQAQKQKSYQRKHRVSTLADFGIDRDRVRKDFAFLYRDDPFGLLEN